MWTNPHSSVYTERKMEDGKISYREGENDFEGFFYSMVCFFLSQERKKGRKGIWKEPHYIQIITTLGVFIYKKVQDLIHRRNKKRDLLWFSVLIYRKNQHRAVQLWRREEQRHQMCPWRLYRREVYIYQVPIRKEPKWIEPNTIKPRNVHNLIKKRDMWYYINKWNSERFWKWRRLAKVSRDWKGLKRRKKVSCVWAMEKKPEEPRHAAKTELCWIVKRSEPKRRKSEGLNVLRNHPLKVNP